MLKMSKPACRSASSASRRPPLAWLLVALLWSGAAAADIRQQSDATLTQMAADWDNLSASDRRKLLSEVQRRMDRRRALGIDAKGAQRPEGQLRIRTERRFGRRVRQADGSVVTITGRVVKDQAVVAPSSSHSSAGVRAKPLRPNAIRRASSPQRFGIGFEKRSDGERVILVPRIVELRPAPVPEQRPLVVGQPADPRPSP